MPKGKISLSELKKQEDYVRTCEDRVATAKAGVKETKAELEAAILKLRAMARGEDNDLDFGGDAERVGGG
jgi:hypothetical protein